MPDYPPLSQLAPKTFGTSSFADWLANMIGQGLTAPGRVLASKEPMTSEQMIQPAQDMMALMATGGIPAAERGAVGAFGGKLTSIPAEGEIVQPMRNVAQRAIEGPSSAHPEWARTYLPGGEIVYSRGDLALREGMSQGQRYFSAVKRFPDNVGGTAYDVRRWANEPIKQTNFTPAEQKELIDAANRLESRTPFINEPGTRMEIK